MAGGFLAVTLFVLAALEKSFVDTAAIPAISQQQQAVSSVNPIQNQQLVSKQQSSQQQQQQDEEEAELESLKKLPSSSSISIIKSHAEKQLNTPEQKQRHSDDRQQVSLDGKLVAALERTMDSSPQQPASARTYLNIPSLGVSQMMETPLPVQQRRSMTQPQPIEPFSQRGQLSAFDMAQYIFWTGDERGVSLAIQEFLQQGLMTREEAVLFLKEIRQGLDSLQNYYAQRREEQQLAEQQALERAAALQQALQSRLISKKSTQMQQVAAPPTTPLLTEEEYSELLQRLKETDALYTELALEEIIYQLAKELFVQKLDRGHGDAQMSLQNFSNLIRNEADGGRIARTLETKLQDVLGASLIDALREKPALEQAAKQIVSSQAVKNKP